MSVATRTETRSPELHGAGRSSRRPSLGRAGAANHPGSAVSSRQPRTTAPQVNLPVRWQLNRSDLAYNDQVVSLVSCPLEDRT